MNAVRLLAVVLVIAAVAFVAFSRASVDQPSDPDSNPRASYVDRPEKGDVIPVRRSESPATDFDSVSKSPPPVTVTAKAVATLKAIAAQDQLVLWWLRVRVTPGGCCGFQHKLDIDTAVTFDDETFITSS